MAGRLFLLCSALLACQWATVEAALLRGVSADSKLLLRKSGSSDDDFDNDMLFAGDIDDEGSAESQLERMHLNDLLGYSAKQAEEDERTDVEESGVESEDDADAEAAVDDAMSSFKKHQEAEVEEAEKDDDGEEEEEEDVEDRAERHEGHHDAQQRGEGHRVRQEENSDAEEENSDAEDDAEDDEEDGEADEGVENVKFHQAAHEEADEGAHHEGKAAAAEAQEQHGDSEDTEEAEEEQEDPVDADEEAQQLEHEEMFGAEGSEDSEDSMEDEALLQEVQKLN